METEFRDKPVNDGAAVTTVVDLAVRAPPPASGRDRAPNTAHAKARSRPSCASSSIATQDSSRASPDGAAGVTRLLGHRIMQYVSYAVSPIASSFVGDAPAWRSAATHAAPWFLDCAAAAAARCSAVWPGAMRRPELESLPTSTSAFRRSKADVVATCPSLAATCNGVQPQTGTVVVRTDAPRFTSSSTHLAALLRHATNKMASFLPPDSSSNTNMSADRRGATLATTSSPLSELDPGGASNHRSNAPASSARSSGNADRGNNAPLTCTLGAGSGADAAASGDGKPEANAALVSTKQHNGNENHVIRAQEQAPRRGCANNNTTTKTR